MADRISSTGQSCDYCGLAVRATWLYLTAEFELTFCDHHDREFKRALKSQGFDRYELSPVGANA